MSQEEHDQEIERLQKLCKLAPAESDQIASRLVLAWQKLASENGVTVQELFSMLCERSKDWHRLQGVKAQKLKMAKLKWGSKHFSSDQSIRLNFDGT